MTRQRQAKKPCLCFVRNESLWTPVTRDGKKCWMLNVHFFLVPRCKDWIPGARQDKFVPTGEKTKTGSAIVSEQAIVLTTLKMILIVLLSPDNNLPQMHWNRFVIKRKWDRGCQQPAASVQQRQGEGGQVSFPSSSQCDAWAGFARYYHLMCAQINDYIVHLL